MAAKRTKTGHPDRDPDACPWCGSAVLVLELGHGQVLTCRRLGCYWWRLTDELGPPVEQAQLTWYPDAKRGFP